MDLSGESRTSAGDFGGVRHTALASAKLRVIGVIQGGEGITPKGTAGYAVTILVVAGLPLLVLIGGLLGIGAVIGR